MPFFIKPFFRKPFKLFAIDADIGQPLDPNVRAKTRVTYYELQNGSNGSKKLVAHKSVSQIAKEGKGEKTEAKPAEETKKEDSKKEVSKKEDAPKGDVAKVEHRGDDVAWTSEDDEKLKAMKAEGKTWAQMVEAMGRHKGQLTVRWKEINPANDGGKKGANEKGGEGGKGQSGNEKQGGGNGNDGQGKQGKKGKKGGDNQQNQNNSNSQKKNDKKNNYNDKSNQDKKEPDNKPASKKEDTKPGSNKPASKSGSTAYNANNYETRFTMTDWLTLQEDDMFSFGELQCLSELIGKDLGQSWQRVTAKFFDLTGRRIHPDDVRDKFESMALMAEGKK